MIIALAGRRIDAPGADTSRFPLTNVPAVRDQIRRLLVEHQACAVVCSAACGADLLALEAAGELGLRRRIVLPYARARFRDTSVVDRPGEWGVLFDQVLDAVEAGGDLVVLGYTEGDEAAYPATNHAILEHADALAELLRQPSAAVVVWDGTARGADDVTAAFLTEAQQRGLRAWQIPTL